jgi:hypothetical protein
MLEFYRLRSEAYFSLSEIFVNGRDYSRERSPYLIELGSVGCGEHRGSESTAGGFRRRVVEKLRMRVDKLAPVRARLWSPWDFRSL